MEVRTGEFGWSHTQAEIQAALLEVMGATDDEEPNYYDKIVNENEEQLMLESNLSRKRLYKRQSKYQRDAEERKSLLQRGQSLAQKKSILHRMSLIRSQLETPSEEREQDSQDKEDIRLETISREGLKALYERQLKVGKGIGRGPYIVPYRFLGTPDLKRDDSLLPKTFQFAKREKFTTAEPVGEICSNLGGQPMVLPLELRAAYWSGGRWCGTTSTASQVSLDSGFNYLYQEIVNSEKRRVNCKTGKYFLQNTNTARGRFCDDSAVPQETRHLSFVSGFNKRQHSKRASVAKPFIPPLPLKSLPKFDLDEQLSFNQEILSAYRDESTYRERLASQRAKSPELEMSEGELQQAATFGTNGFPLKACEDTSLRQLESILETKASFRAMQHDLNTKLVNSLRAMETARPYHFAHEFTLKGGGSHRPKIACDPAATPRRADALRAHMEKCRWFEELLKMAYLNGRHPTKTELYMIQDIRSVLDQGNDYTLDEYTNLIQVLGKKKMDMDSHYPEKALVHVKTSLQLDDVELLSNLIGARSRLPAWLERQTNLVKQVIRDLSPNRFPMSQWSDKSKARKKFQYHPRHPPSTKHRKLVTPHEQTASWKKRPTDKAQTARF
ncbi:hypothetical protein MPTK1_3g11390 [Marchantia polymorpha subsp. ruderalis]|uniref:Uncharacterized protein n=2 Tax=Marchantia polymorpha TaxID=3197 RepID=A0A176VTL8_MARPO|nr:hypothetical protein AXG93_1630s1110 [Marchantia polymorpha subsp. ruderalis]PTQ40877.1 hypothetical protein MARPO_0037s0058 [Marchantia polymorpha]PTQ40878.1 hypothetical protein MARPO_0037s0058 [Marchantia polymorpha]BBN05227.1 hypothetical protein Mp_3g11390 [Marchantia polymorpha subsp. ruderalis]BBN05228.1 hypothetical protein Mp_3g11390 [Marchantia polymorpha subsp. ruderalis]|eukprot:PTQ40877.1 hypothetical protein MARPO_0037s0058 [Marchantia polymorpha]